MSVFRQSNFANSVILVVICIGAMEPAIFKNNNNNLFSLGPDLTWRKKSKEKKMRCTSTTANMNQFPRSHRKRIARNNAEYQQK
jgi:hypothetical protein